MEDRPWCREPSPGHWDRRSYYFGVVRISVNGRTAADRLDLFSDRPAVREVELGAHDPVEGRFAIRCELLEAGPRSRGARTFMGLDRIDLEEAPR